MQSFLDKLNAKMLETIKSKNELLIHIQRLDDGPIRHEHWQRWLAYAGAVEILEWVTQELKQSTPQYLLEVFKSEPRSARHADVDLFFTSYGSLLEELIICSLAYPEAFLIRIDKTAEFLRFKKEIILNCKTWKENPDLALRQEEQMAKYKPYLCMEHEDLLETMISKYYTGSGRLFNNADWAGQIREMDLRNIERYLEVYDTIKSRLTKQ